MGNVKYDPRFGRGLSKLMEREELTNAMVSDFAQMDVGMVSRIKRGVTTPTERTKKRLAKVFRVTVEEVEKLGEEAAPG